MQGGDAPGTRRRVDQMPMQRVMFNRSDSMRLRSVLWTAVLAVVVGFAADGRADDMAAYSSVNLNIRSGPSVRFPVVGMAAGGSSMTIHGCLAHYTWCDVSASGVRGWASGAHLEFVYEDRRVYVPAYATHVDVPIVSFHVVNYWNDHYHDRDFYADLDQWTSYHWEDDGLPPGWRDNWDEHYGDDEY
jgi:uncharacterized protein YraI